MNELELFLAAEHNKSLPDFIFMAKWKRIAFKYKQSLGNKK